MSHPLLAQALRIEDAVVAMLDCAQTGRWSTLEQQRRDCQRLIARYRELRDDSALSRRQSTLLADALLRIVRLDAKIRALQQPSGARIDALLRDGGRRHEGPAR